MIEKEKGEEKERIEVGVVLIEEVIMTIKGVVSMVTIRDLRGITTTKARVTVIRAIVTTNHPTNLLSSLFRINSKGMANSTTTTNREGMIVGMETAVVATVATGVVSLALPAIGVSGFSIIYTELATGKLNALLSLSARFVVALT